MSTNAASRTGPKEDGGRVESHLNLHQATVLFERQVQNSLSAQATGVGVDSSQAFS